MGNYLEIELLEIHISLWRIGMAFCGEWERKKEEGIINYFRQADVYINSRISSYY